MIFFLDSNSLHEFVRVHDVITWHGCYGIGNLNFIDSPDLHVVFLSRSEYEKWDNDGCPVNFQLSLC